MSKIIDKWILRCLSAIAFQQNDLIRIAGSQVSSARFKGFWGRGMTGTKVPLKIIPTRLIDPDDLDSYLESQAMDFRKYDNE